jgi:hypothetical protein
MTVANRLKAAENLPILSKEAFQPSSRLTFGLKSIFVGPNGLRAGWRVLMFIALFAVLFGSFVLIRAGGPQGFREQYKNQSHITITPLLMGGWEAITLLFLCIAALVMGKIEHRKFSEYGLPPRLALRKDFWIGSNGLSDHQRDPSDDVSRARVPCYRPGDPRDGNLVLAFRVGHRISAGRTR